MSFLSFHRSEEFKLESLDLGQLIKIRIRHDNLNGDGWFLEKITVKDEKTGAFYIFTAGRWLDSKQEDKKIDIIILVDKSLVPGEPGGEIKAADIGIILDGSRGVQEENFKRQLELVKLIIQSFRVSQEEVHFGIAVTTLKSEVVIQLDEYTDSATLQAGVDKLSYPAGRRNTGAAIKLAQDQLFTKARAGIPRVLIIFVGGKLKDNTIEPAEAIKKTGTKLVVIGIRKKVNPVVKQLKSIASKPDFVIIQQWCANGYKVQFSNQTIGPINTTPSSGKQFHNQNAINASTSADTIDSMSGKERFTTISPEVLEYMEIINELLNTTEAQQMAFMSKIEETPSDGETVNPLSKEVLITKATAQATLHCLYQCLGILQKQIDDARDVARNSGIPEEATIQWFGPPEPKTVPHSAHPHLLHSHSIPSIPSSSGSISSNKKTYLSCCYDNYVDGVEFDTPLEDEVEDDMKEDHEYSLESENIEEHKSLILHLLSKLKLGMDLTKVPLPTFILEPRSLLEMFADFYGYPDLFLKISEQQSAEERMLAAVEYYLTSFYAARKGHYSKKPYNPVLGEIFQCSWEGCDRQTHGDVSKTETTEESRDCRLRYVAEQVSHHPPVSAFYVECPQKNMCMNCHIWTKSKFYGMSIGVELIGDVSAFYVECPQKNMCMNCHIWTKSKFYGMSIGVELIGDGVLTLLNHDEEYVFTFPNAYCRSILTHPWHELGGKVNISCSKTGFSSSITFHTKPMYGGIRDQITGEVKHLPSGRVVCRINGQWTEKIEMTFPDKGVQQVKVIEPNVMKKTCKNLRPVSLQHDNESR
ncbi:oxysterol-binding -related 10 isoform X3, partial [Paramuricea clavata]